MHLKSLTSPRKGKRNSIARGVDGHAVANHDEASSPVNKRVRLATADATSGSETRGSAPRVKLLLSTKKTKAKTAGNTVPTEVDPKQVPFGGRLTESDADISTCIPTVSDRARFKKARMQAEKVSAASTPDINPEDAGNGDFSLLNDEVFYAPAEPKIKSIYFGTREINTWYSAPYPEEYNGQSHIYICEYCFKYMKSQYVAGRHKTKCPLRHPPGDEIYRDGNISVFEIYCQNLCLLAKMFLDHKTLYYDVEPFLFYILTENDERGCHFVGYFSKEKRSSANYNLSCIVTMPISQRKGYGGLLIEFSYLLSRKEGRTGSPEKPLSDLGLVTYRRYWRRTVLRALHEWSGEQVSIEEVSQLTCMTPDDIIHTLHLLDMLKKNAHGDYVIRYPAALINSFIEAVNAKNMATVKPDLLRWTPLLFKAPMVTVAEEPTTPDTPVVANTDANELEGEGEESHKDIEDPPSGNKEETA
ncbi:hypothetical protein PhCBS80983_g02311 [Powellomyces hirtus]|uniref:Histone acetyltransferase n=1 Tax=Powellomyces hirtus TaxID=109895 RepID=A0A507E7E8_9FUNG|nr:hypothetical protein PhCBS80983_g02311 [Powellomyces hirtus]